MNTSHPYRTQQAGSMLLEGLIAILIFSMGILAIVGLQATSIKNSTDAKYRTDASLLADKLIGQMWMGDHTPATLQTNFSSPSGASYLAWLADVQAALPGVTGGNLPTVTIVQVNGSSPPTTISSQVTVQLFWKMPNEPAANPAHNYTAIAQIK